MKNIILKGEMLRNLPDQDFYGGSFRVVRGPTKSVHRKEKGRFACRGSPDSHGRLNRGQTWK